MNWKMWAVLFYIGMTMLALLAFNATVMQYKDEHYGARVWPVRLLVFIGMCHGILASAIVVGTFD